MNRLKGKVALVTGGSRGIGREISLRLAREGAMVAVHYGSKQAAAREVVEAIIANGGEAFPIGANLGSVSGVHQLLQLLDEELKDRTGDIHYDILVNNAGIGIPESFEETTEAAFDEIFAVNIKAPFFLVQQSMSRLRDEGRIINISSGVTRVAYPSMMAYNLTKGAINTFTLHLAKLLGSRGITVNAVLPGLVRTDMNADFLDSSEAPQLPADMVALGRMGEPSDIADVVAFLASRDGRFVTAQLLDATGGSHL
ncbi:SDR family oxidoreductase [Paenibacillus sp. SAF-054]|uniref:SDR family oxidoreductase n=1 Tax=unclassified Paenibacillus TaxID=185978 RepID=UPI003F7DB967